MNNMKVINKQKIEIIFTVKRIWELEDETIEDVRRYITDEAGEYLYGGSGNESIDVEVKEIQ